MNIHKKTKTGDKISPVRYNILVSDDVTKSKDGGHSCPPDEDWPFFRPRDAIRIHHNRLPHWQQDAASYFVTWHLADSISQRQLNEWREQRDHWLILHPKPWDETVRHEYSTRFTVVMEQWLDAGMGSCLLRNQSVSEIVSTALLFFHHQRYTVDCFVVMPNHVHVVFRLHEGYRLEAVIKSWKGYTARQINLATGQSGSVWMEDYWDTLIRNPEHLERCRSYVEHNPIKAGLQVGAYRLFENPQTGDRNVPPPGQHGRGAFLPPF